MIDIPIPRYVSSARFNVPRSYHNLPKLRSFRIRRGRSAKAWARQRVKTRIAIASRRATDPPSKLRRAGRLHSQLPGSRVGTSSVRPAIRVRTHRGSTAPNPSDRRKSRHFARRGVCPTGTGGIAYFTWRARRRCPARGRGGLWGRECGGRV